MTTETLEVRVSDLEKYMKELAYQSMLMEMSIKSLSEEMKEFKDEMKVFKEEMQKDLKDYKEENARQNREMNRRWGELANKMGTLAEDIVAPNIPRIARELFELNEPKSFAVRYKRRRDSHNREYDVIAAYEEHVLVNETKSSLDSKDIDPLLRRWWNSVIFSPNTGPTRSSGSSPACTSIRAWSTIAVRKAYWSWPWETIPWRY